MTSPPQPLYGVGQLVQVADRESLERLGTDGAPGARVELFQLDLSGQHRRVSAVAFVRGEVVYRLAGERGTWPERSLLAIEEERAPAGPAVPVVDASGQTWKTLIVFPFVIVAGAAYATSGKLSTVLWASRSRAVGWRRSRRGRSSGVRAAAIRGSGVPRQRASRRR